MWKLTTQRNSGQGRGSTGLPTTRNVALLLVGSGDIPGIPILHASKAFGYVFLYLILNIPSIHLLYHIVGHYPIPPSRRSTSQPTPSVRNPTPPHRHHRHPAPRPLPSPLWQPTHHIPAYINWPPPCDRAFYPFLFIHAIHWGNLKLQISWGLCCVPRPCGNVFALLDAFESAKVEICGRREESQGSG